MFARISILVLMVAALIAFPSTAAAARQHDDILITPNPVVASSRYHVDICGVRGNTLTEVDTTGPGSFGYRREYTSDASGCIHYGDVSGSITGQYAITVQQMRGGNLVVLGSTVFTVK